LEEPSTGDKTTAKIKSSWRIFFGGFGLFLASIMAIAIIAVVNTWRLYSLPTTFTIELLVVTGTIFVGGIWSLSIAIRGKMPSRRSRLASLVLVALLLAEMLLVLILIFTL